MLSTARALALSTHPGPSVAVSAIVVMLGLGAGLDPWRLAFLFAAVVTNQLSVGLSNDWLDAERDRAVGRTDKPIAQGLVSAPLARGVAILLAVLSLLLPLPLGWGAVAANAVFLGSGWLYNAVLKSSVFSVVPYLLGFGALPLVVSLAQQSPSIASPWAVLAGALLGVAAHFANVLPDLDDDHATGVRGLPHRVGLRTSGVVIAGALAGASASIVFGLGDAPPVFWAGLLASAGLAVACATLVWRGKTTRLVFRLIIVGALLDVALLALSGSRLLV